MACSSLQLVSIQIRADPQISVKSKKGFPSPGSRSALALNNLFTDCVTFAPNDCRFDSCYLKCNTENYLDPCSQWGCRVRSGNWALSAEVHSIRYPCASKSLRPNQLLFSSRDSGWNPEESTEPHLDSVWWPWYWATLVPFRSVFFTLETGGGVTGRHLTRLSFQGKLEQLRAPTDSDTCLKFTEEIKQVSKHHRRRKQKEEIAI